MRIKLSLKRSVCAGETFGQEIEVYLRNCFSLYDVIETIRHESLHASINKFVKTTGKQDHYILKRMDVDAF